MAISSTSRTGTPFIDLLRMAALLVWAVMLAYLSLASGVRALPGPLGWDKLNHFAAYGLLAFLAVPVIPKGRRFSRRLLGGVWFGCFAYGALLETLQWGMASGRRWELADLAANALGALAACLLRVLFCRIRGVASQA